MDAQALETVLSFDMACTKAYAELLAKSRAAGLAIEAADAFNLRTARCP